MSTIPVGQPTKDENRYLRAEKKFAKIDVFEQRAEAGGVWNYTPTTRADGFTVPRTQPTTCPDQPIYHKGSEVAEFVSPVYDFLETNIPHVLMNYTDQKFPDSSSLFPPHREVLKYLQKYAEDLEPIISYGTQVLEIKKIRSTEDGVACWQVETLDLKSGKRTKGEYDAVAVASGHYNDPFVPDIKGLAQFEKRWPGSISHSKFYRRPDQFKNKVRQMLTAGAVITKLGMNTNSSSQRVIVVGNSASGIDLSIQISSVASLPVFISEKEKLSAGNVIQEDKPWAANVPEIVEFLPEERAVRFSNGRIEKDIDSVVFCTGYHYSFPFLRHLEPSIVVPDGSHAAHLWEHILYAADPTLAFLSIPQRIVPFPVSEAQSGLIARIWADRLPTPSRSEMEGWIEELRREKGENKTIHNLASPKDINYINRLYDRSMEAKRVPGLENDGVGKIPPYWDAEKAWTRERFPAIKLAVRALGEGRHEVRTLKELRFDYKEWKRTTEAAEKLL